MEGHKQMLDKEYETLLTSFRKELEKLHVKHQQELERKVGIRKKYRVCKLVLTNCIFRFYFLAEAKFDWRKEVNKRNKRTTFTRAKEF